MLDQEIDLTPYLRRLLSYWWWPLVGAILLGIVGWFYTQNLPNEYQATTLVTINRERYQLTLDDRFQTIDGYQLINRTYTELALSDRVMDQVAAILTAEIDERWSPHQLRHHLQAEVGHDLDLIRLQATATNPAEATLMANVWGEVFAQVASEAYQLPQAEALILLEAELAQAEQVWQQTQQNLLQFSQEDKAWLWQNELQVLTKTHLSDLAMAQTVAQLTDEVLRLQAQGTSEPMAINELLLVLWQLEAFGPTKTLPVTITLTESSLLTPSEQATLLAGLLTYLQEKEQEIEERLAEMPAKILPVQQAYQANEQARQQLTLAHDLARTAYITLAQKVTETRILAQSEPNAVQIISPAIPPTVPAGPRRLLLTVLSMLLGFLLGGLAAVSHVIWMQWRPANRQTDDG